MERTMQIFILDHQMIHILIRPYGFPLMVTHSSLRLRHTSLPLRRHPYLDMGLHQHQPHTPSLMQCLCQVCLFQPHMADRHHQIRIHIHLLTRIRRFQVRIRRLQVGIRRLQVGLHLLIQTNRIPLRLRNKTKAITQLLLVATMARPLLVDTIQDINKLQVIV